MAGSGAPFAIAQANSADDIAAAQTLFRAYAATLDIDLAYQDFDREMETLPGRYAPPRGALLLARGEGGAVLGCVALREIAPAGTCEMKRLYVVPQARGLRVGRALLDAVIATAARIGYSEMRLDTLPGMDAALGLYEGAGFVSIEPYYATPVAGTRFLAKRLAAASN